MLQQVPTPSKSLGDYAAVVGAEPIARLREIAKPFKGARVLNVNSTAFGGGVAELLYTMVPLMRDLGIEADWQLMQAPDEFFVVTKAMHNALQGGPVPWTPEMRALYQSVSENNAEMFEGDYDFVIIHDSQPAAILHELIEDRGIKPGNWIWRCHIDLTEPYEPVWQFVQPFVEQYDAAIFTLEEFVRPGLKVPHVAIIPPSIDPLSIKNIPMDGGMVDEVMRRYQIDTTRPLVVQVSRFDPWKDPLGVIDAFRIARREYPGLQLALIASMAHDDPEGWEYYTKTEEYRDGDPDIFLLSNLQEVGALGVNAFQRAADVVVQKSIREGFGLVVSEAMWKGRPVIGSDVGGIKLQIIDGETGYLVSDVDACAKRIVDLLADKEHSAEIGYRARVFVKERFLSMRDIEDHLALFAKLSS
ncbi:MAG: glycosyltransferase [Actinomycetota bacterium]|nr:glycosyltransferase [Actinomycetota bacterium]